MELELANYKINGKLGEGGMAVVYLAEQTTLHREVAIKVLRRELMYNGDIKRRFLDEGRKLASLNHEHIIRVFDLISRDDVVAIVMERVDGLTLKELLESYGKMEKKDCMDLLSQMTSALGYVHNQGYIHRDVKPSNFMVTNKGKVKLLDFGIAKDTGEEAMIRTQTGTGAMGTPMYMSPEQIKEVSKVERQTDIYSLGVVLWQMLSGEKPYQGMTLSDFDLKYKIVHEPLKRLGNEFDEVISKATEKQVEYRYRTCDEMWDAVEKSSGLNMQNGFANKLEAKSIDLDTKTFVEVDRTLFEDVNINSSKNEKIVFEKIEKPQILNQVEKNQEKTPIGYLILAIIFPLAGIIMAVNIRKKYPDRVKTYLIATIIGLIVSSVVNTIFEGAF
jgi:serine/threonine-protein kinase